MRLSQLTIAACITSLEYTQINHERKELSVNATNTAIIEVTLIPNWVIENKENLNLGTCCSIVKAWVTTGGEHYKYCE